jgi:hypothetical protein
MGIFDGVFDQFNAPAGATAAPPAPTADAGFSFGDFFASSRERASKAFESIGSQAQKAVTSAITTENLVGIGKKLLGNLTQKQLQEGQRGSAAGASIAPSGMPPAASMRGSSVGDSIGGMMNGKNMLLIGGVALAGILLLKRK